MKNVQSNQTFSIKEAAKELKVSTGTIRRWEKDLNGILDIQRTAQGARIYTSKELELLKKIKEWRGKNLSADTIKELVSKYLENGKIKIETSQTNELAVPHTIPSINETLQKEMASELERIKNELANEFRCRTTEMVNEIKDELAHASLHTIKELSKSIQRSNEKRKLEVQKLEETLEQMSEDHYEAFASLSSHVAHTAMKTAEQLSLKIGDMSKTQSKENKILLNKLNKNVSFAKNELEQLNESLNAAREQLMDELEKQREEIQRREEAFAHMITNFRQAAASAERKKRWWNRLMKMKWL